MLRHRAALRDDGDAMPPARLLYSARTFGDVIYRAEIEALATADDTLRTAYTLTRSRPPDWTGHRRRIDLAMPEQFVGAPDGDPLMYVCGPTAMVEAVATALVDLGHRPVAIRTERFGPSGSP